MGEIELSEASPCHLSFGLNQAWLITAKLSPSSTVTNPLYKIEVAKENPLGDERSKSIQHRFPVRSGQSLMFSFDGNYYAFKPKLD